MVRTLEQGRTRRTRLPLGRPNANSEALCCMPAKGIKHSSTFCQSRGAAQVSLGAPLQPGKECIFKSEVCCSKIAYVVVIELPQPPHRADIQVTPCEPRTPSRVSMGSSNVHLHAGYRGRAAIISPQGIIAAQAKERASLRNCNSWSMDLSDRSIFIGASNEVAGVPNASIRSLEQGGL